MFDEDDDFDVDEYLSKLSGFEAAIIRNTIKVYKLEDNRSIKKSKYDINMDIQIIDMQNNDEFSQHFQDEQNIPMIQDKNIISKSSKTIEKIHFFNDETENHDLVINYDRSEENGRDCIVNPEIDQEKNTKTKDNSVSNIFKIKKYVQQKPIGAKGFKNKKMTKVIHSWLDNIDPSHNLTIDKSITVDKSLKTKDNKIQSRIVCGSDGRMIFSKANANNIESPKPIDKNIFKDAIKKIDEDTINVILENIATNTTEEIGFCIIYREGVCQLNDLSTSNDVLTPKTLVLFVQRNGLYNYYYMNINKNQSNETDSKRSLIKSLMLCNARKICYRSQDLILLLIQMFKFERHDVCLQWLIIDPEICCYLLDPDDPPLTFHEVLSEFDITPPIERSNANILEVAASYLPLLSECCRKMYAKLSENNIWFVFINMEAKISPILSCAYLLVMEFRGICIDTRALNGMSSALETTLKSVERTAMHLIGKPLQLNSPNQLRTVLYDDLKLDVLNDIKVKETSATGTKSTSESVLRQLIPFHPLPALILNYRHVYKAKATYIDAILKQSNGGIITATWDQTATATGRISSCNPNLQAIPKQPFSLKLIPVPDDIDNALPSLMLRNAFVARSGYWLVAADFQHIECRVFAHLTNDEALIQIIRQDFDIFKSLAQKWLNIQNVHDVTVKEREKTKRIVYAMMYGAGNKKLMEILELDEESVSKIAAEFLQTFPALQTFKQSVIAKCQSQHGILHSISGRMRKFPNISSSNYKLRSQAERQAINFVIQGSAADLCKTAMIATECRLMNLSDVTMNHHLVLQIHDELVWEVPEDHVSKFKFIVQEVMQCSGEFCGNISVPLPVVITQGRSWGEMF